MRVAILMVVCVSLFAQENKADDMKKAELKYSISGYIFSDIFAVTESGETPKKIPEAPAVVEAGLGAKIMPAQKVNVRVDSCFSCHGLELDNAYGEYKHSDALNFRVGRFNVPFGAFNQRHDQPTIESSSKPLPYIMGMMDRQSVYNLGIVPAPWSDNGVDIFGTAFVGMFKFGYDLYATKGLEGASPDVNFIATRDFNDSNSRLAPGGRVSVGTDWFTLGFSIDVGEYDAKAQLGYEISGIDLCLSWKGLTLRTEYAQRKTDFVDAAGKAGEFEKNGFYGELDGELFAAAVLFYRFDFLEVRDIALSANGPTTTPALAITDDKSSIKRSTFGARIAVSESFSIKASVELWNFDEFKDDTVYHLGAVFTY